MTGFVLHPEAYNDLDEIWEYIAADNLVAADRVLDEIYQMLRSLVAFPHQGHSRPDPGQTKPRAYRRADEVMPAQKQPQSAAPP